MSDPQSNAQEPAQHPLSSRKKLVNRAEALILRHYKGGHDRSKWASDADDVLDGMEYYDDDINSGTYFARAFHKLESIRDGRDNGAKWETNPMPITRAKSE